MSGGVWDTASVVAGLASVAFDHPLFLITHPYIAHCIRACSAKGAWSLFSLSLFSLSPLYTVLPVNRA